jgi:hypothetical protein
MKDDCDQGPTSSATTSEDNVEMAFVHAVYKQATNVQKRTPSCLLCSKKDHYFNACPNIDPKDTKLHLRLQLQINNLLDQIKKKGTNNVIPINEMTLLDTDQAEATALADTSPDFREGSS